ncbi:MAG: hypothetical protein V7K62_03685 [Nostoc sp.]
MIKIPSTDVWVFQKAIARSFPGCERSPFVCLYDYHISRYD